MGKKYRVREIVISALRGQPGTTDFEAMSTKTTFFKIFAKECLLSSPVFKSF
jgi:hypothetical protein